MRWRVKSLLCLLAIFAVGLGFSQTKKPLTNDDVLQMVRAGFEEPMIIKAIKANDTNFDTSAQGLVGLKNAGVSQAIIEAMLDAEGRKKTPEATTATGDKPAAPEAKASSSEPPGLPGGIGVFYRAVNGWVQLEMLQASTMKSKGWGKAFATGGIASTQMVNIYKSPEAPIQISEARPTFCVRYPGLGSGRDVVIVRMDKKKDHRELQVTQGATLITASTGYNQKDIVEVTVKPLAEGLYAITPKTDLVGGEYVLNIGMEYDFGIKLVK